MLYIVSHWNVKKNDKMYEKPTWIFFFKAAKKSSWYWALDMQKLNMYGG